MTVFDTYGSNFYTAEELCSLLADRLTVAFAKRESDYRGVYFLATLADTTCLEIQLKAIPGDDGEVDLYEDEYPDVSLLLLVTSPAAAESLSDEILAVEGLTQLRSARS